MDAVHIVVLGVSSLAPITVLAALMLSFRDWLYRDARSKLGRW